MKKQKDRIYRVQTGEFDSQFQILSAGKKHGQQMWRLARSGPWDLGVPFLPVRKNEEDSISVGAEEGHLRYSGPPSIDDSEELGIF